MIVLEEKNNEDDVQRLLGAPFGLEYGEAAQRVRRNLLALSMLAIALIATGAKVEEPEIFGFKLTSVSDHAIRVALVCSLLYLVVHFVWHAIELFAEWRVRLTGTRLAFQTGPTRGSDDADYPETPRQSTLYRWWNDNQANVEQVLPILIELQAQIRSYLEDGRDWGAASTKVETPSLPALQGILKRLEEVQRRSESSARIISSPRIQVSLARFDRWFYYVSVSQNLRWIFLETLVPLALGTAAIILLAAEQWMN